MTRASAFVAWLVLAMAVGATSQQVAEPILYTETRTTPSTFRDRGPAYAPTYFVYADTQRSAGSIDIRRTSGPTRKTKRPRLGSRPLERPECAHRPRSARSSGSSNAR